jgi:3-hydroxyisobutyrate dehydrogenase
VLDVYRSHVLGKAPASALLIDCSTIDVASARSIEEEAAAQGYTMVDAPVSGGIAAAASGNLAFMVGGSDEAFGKAKPILEPMAKAVIHAGSPGAGQAAKICNNMILGATMIVTCEAFVMAQKLGLDPKVFHAIASSASGQSWSMTTYTPVPDVGPETPADHDYEGGFAAVLMLKDLKLAMEAAQQAGAYTPMGGEAADLYARFVNLGGGSKDFSGIIKMIDDSWKAPAGAKEPAPPVTSLD